MIELVGLLAGLVIGCFLPWHVPSQYSLYVATGLLAALDSALGGMNARIKRTFNLSIFLSGFFGNAIIAVFLNWLGDKLGLPLYLAAVVVFGTRMFQNFAEIRRELLTSRQKKARIERDINNGQASGNELP